MEVLLNGCSTLSQGGLPLATFILFVFFFKLMANVVRIKDTKEEIKWHNKKGRSRKMRELERLTTNI